MAGITATLAFLAATAWAPFGPVAALWFDDLGTLAAACLAVGLALQAARRSQGRVALGWRTAAVALALWAFGNLVWAFEELILRLPEEQLFPSLADVGFLSFSPMMLVALWLFAPRATDPLFRARAIVDALWTTGAVLLLSWVLILRATVGLAAGFTLADTLAFLYPFLDVLLAGAALNLVVRADPALRRSHLALAAGVLLLAVADSGFAYAIVKGVYSTGAVTDAGWFAGLLLLCAAAMLAGPEGTPTTTPTRPSRVQLPQLMSPYAAFLVAVVVAAWTWSRSGSDPVGVWITVATVLLLVVREGLAHAEVLRLGRRLQSALQAAEAAVVSRDAVVRAVVHDLRNTITPLRLQLRVLLTGPEDERVAKPVAAMKRSLAQAELLIDDLQDMAALESGRLKMEAVTFDLAGLAREVADETQPGASAAGLELVLEPGAGPVPVRGDPRRTGQVLRNLVSNACKFTPAPGRVRISVRVAAGMARVGVSDTGRGISAGDLGRLFRPFERVGSRGPGDPKGTGLGLYISRGFMERQRGTLEATSPGEGKGSEFTLTLPCEPDVSGPMAATATVPATTG